MVSKAYVNPETAKVWTDTGGDYAMDMGGLAADAVRVGAQGDLGAAPRAFSYDWKLIIDGFDTAPVVGETVNIYLSFSSTASAAEQDGDVGVSDAAGATDDLPNLRFLGVASVQTTTAGDELIISGQVDIFERYVSPVVHNDTADALLSTADAHKFILTPTPYEGQ